MESNFSFLWLENLNDPPKPNLNNYNLGHQLQLWNTLHYNNNCNYCYYFYFHYFNCDLT